MSYECWEFLVINMFLLSRFFLKDTLKLFLAENQEELHPTSFVSFWNRQLNNHTLYIATGHACRGVTVGMTWTYLFLFFIFMSLCVWTIEWNIITAFKEKLSRKCLPTVNMWLLWEGFASLPVWRCKMTTTNINSCKSDKTIEPTHCPLLIQKRNNPTHHVVDIFEDGGETTDDKGELIFWDVDQTFLVVLCADFGVGVLVSNFNGKLKEKTKRMTMQTTHRSTPIVLHDSEVTLPLWINIPCL